MTENAEGAVVPDAESSLVAYTTDFSNGHQQHVIFVDAYGHIQEMYFEGSLPWRSFDLNEEAARPDVTAALPWALSGYMTTYTEPHQQHVNFVSASDNHIYELYFDVNTHWHLRDLTNVAVPKPGMYGFPSQLSGYQTTWDSSQHVNFIDTNGHVSELYRVK